MARMSGLSSLGDLVIVWRRTARFLDLSTSLMLSEVSYVILASISSKENGIYTLTEVQENLTVSNFQLKIYNGWLRIFWGGHYKSPVRIFCQNNFSNRQPLNSKNSISELGWIHTFQQQKHFGVEYSDCNYSYFQYIFHLYYKSKRKNIST